MVVVIDLDVSDITSCDSSWTNESIFIDGLTGAEHISRHLSQPVLMKQRYSQKICAGRYYRVNKSWLRFPIVSKNYFVGLFHLWFIFLLLYFHDFW